MRWHASPQTQAKDGNSRAQQNMFCKKGERERAWDKGNLLAYPQKREARWDKGKTNMELVGISPKVPPPPPSQTIQNVQNTVPGKELKMAHKDDNQGGKLSYTTTEPSHYVSPCFVYPFKPYHRTTPNYICNVQRVHYAHVT